MMSMSAAQELSAAEQAALRDQCSVFLAGHGRETAADLRRRIGDRDDEPTDAAERSALIEAAEEQEALIDQLEARREELLRRLG